SEIVEAIRPKLAAALRAAFERGQHVSDSRYADKIAQASRLLNELSNNHPDIVDADGPDIPIGSAWTRPTAERAALGTVKPRILELVSRDIGASISEIEAIGLKPNSIRGTLYSLQKDDKILRSGDRWYAVTPGSNEAPTAEAAEASKSSDAGSEALAR